MKLLLTSAGLTNKTISDALIEMVKKPVKEISIAFVPTAANYERGDKGWLIEDLINIKKQNFKSVDVVDISALEKEQWLEGLEKADVLFFGGGNTFHLMYWVEKSGLKELLPKFLENKVYAGISAGSCITSPKVDMDFLNLLFPEEENKHDSKLGLNLVPFYIVPHLNSYTKRLKEDNVRKVLENVKEQVYVIDNQCALEVNNDKVKVIGEGKHFEIL